MLNRISGNSQAFFKGYIKKVDPKDDDKVPTFINTDSIKKIKPYEEGVDGDRNFYSIIEFTDGTCTDRFCMGTSELKDICEQAQ